jgi:hypothetical protein
LHDLIGPITPTERSGGACAAIIVFTVANLLGLRTGGRIQVGMAALKLAALALLISVGFGWGRWANVLARQATGAQPTGTWSSWLLFGMIPILFTFELLGHRVARNGVYKQNTLSISWSAEAFLHAWRTTRKRRFLRIARRCIDELSLYQAVWDPHFLPAPAHGGFGVMNADCEWNDARQSLFAPLYLDFALGTGDRELTERGVSALRASFSMLYCPENPHDSDAGMYDELGEIVVGLDADGVMLDTMDDVPEPLARKLHLRKRDVVFAPELRTRDADLGHLRQSWAQWSDIGDPTAPSIYRHRWLVPQHRLLAIRRWDTSRKQDIVYSFFNGSGLILWDNVFGTWNPYSREDRRLIAETAAIFDHYQDLFVHAIRATAVNNAEFLEFVHASGYRPKDGQSFLKHVVRTKDGLLPTKLPSELETLPVTFVSLTDAAAYAAWCGQRLPTEAEWQWASEGAGAGNRYPWGNDPRSFPNEMRPAFDPTTATPQGVMGKSGNAWELTESEYTDGHTRFAMLRGGTFLPPGQSEWLAPRGVHPNDHHAKYVLLSDGLDRSASISFRTVTELADPVTPTPTTPVRRRGNR